MKDNQSGSEVDLVPGTNSAHSPLIIHQDSVHENLNKRVDNEELINDLQRKSNTVS